MATTDQFKVLRGDLERMCSGNQRLVKAFENLFRMLPINNDPTNEAIEAAQTTADTATAQALLAITLIDAVNQLAELVSTQPVPTCTCTEYEDLSARTEQMQQDIITPSYQLIEPMNLNLEVT